MPDFTNQYNTPLTAQELADYNTKFKSGDSYDYDMQGWYKANPNSDPNGKGVHYPDTYKKPNHPTFSDQSQYNGNGNTGGKWQQQQDGSYTFTPGSTNLQMFQPDELQNYFNKVEPKNKLILPDPPAQS